MNIHTTNKTLVNSLNNSTIAKIKVGSHLYNMQNKNSDIDYLNIYIESDKNLASFMWEHHQIQYKENNIDENYSSVQSFIRNILTGDATINFECLYSNELMNSELGWLCKYKEDFIGYNIIKSYLGLAKRDLKYYLKNTKGLREHTIETNKKLHHLVRGVIFANMLLNSNFTLDLSKINSTYKNLSAEELLMDIKNGLMIKDSKEIFNHFKEYMSSLRDILNKKFEKGEINRFMNVKSLEIIDKRVKEYKNNKDIDYGNIFYKALENGITY